LVHPPARTRRYRQNYGTCPDPGRALSAGQLDHLCSPRRLVQGQASTGVFCPQKRVLLVLGLFIWAACLDVVTFSRHSNGAVTAGSEVV
ncbi:hypothetical protein H4582DRAFT_2132223, partial [Lactarius indigo]